jgi:hypothetical protein
MIRLRWGFIYFVIALLAGFSMAATDAGIDKKVMDHFEINWESLRYNKTVTQYNPEVSSNQQPSRTDENLTLGCKVEIKDPNLVLGIARNGVLTEMTDSKRQNIEISQEQPGLGGPGTAGMRSMPSRWSMEMAYEGLRYEKRFTQPPVISRWRALLRKFLRIPQTPFRPVLVDELQPAHLQFELDLGLLETSGGKIRSLKGYFYALMAESVEHIEVPFEPNDQWVRLTDDVAIQVREARNTISGSRTRYNFEIEEDRKAARRGMDRLSVGDYLPEKIVMDRQFVKEDGEPFDLDMGFGFLPAHVGGRGSGSGSGGPVKKIRFVIAVNPKHCKIPLELKNIPLPNPELKDEKEF